MLPGELHEAAFRRYCDQEHSSKYSRYRITYVGPAVDCTGRTSEDCRADRALNAEMKRLWNTQKGTP